MGTKSHQTAYEGVSGSLAILCGQKPEKIANTYSYARKKIKKKQIQFVRLAEQVKAVRDGTKVMEAGFYETGIEFEDNAVIVLLVTCSYQTEKGRCVVAGIESNDRIDLGTFSGETELEAEDQQEGILFPNFILRPALQQSFG